ncbi:MAG: hypothetical protein GY711_26040 [bacterium]|nr:hypothetical protein [bacterium]
MKLPFLPFAALALFASVSLAVRPSPAEAEAISTQAPRAPGEHDVMESAFCANCHPAIYAEHEQSTHGRAFTDQEVRLATAHFEVGDCIVCHTPRPIFETGVGQNPRRRHYGLTEGVSCMTCHWRPNYDYGAFTGGTQCVDAFHPDVGTVDACASCHRNHGTPYQWEKAPTGKVTGRSCMDCHMEVVERPVAVGGPVREVLKHDFPGSRSESQVKRAYAYTAKVDGDAAVVKIVNRGTGHNFPTELKQRSVESLVVVRDLEGNEVARSRMVFRDPYKRPYGLELLVNTQIPAGETRTHRVPLGVVGGTVECTLFFKLYYPIDDYHSDLSRVLESRVLPFSGITPSTEPVESEAEVVAIAPEGIDPTIASPANLVDFARPDIDTVAVTIPDGDTPDDIQGLIDLFQFPVPEANIRARERLIAIGAPTVPLLIDALGSWDNKTYNQALTVLAGIGEGARAATLTACDDERLYVRLHARELIARKGWRGDDTEAILRTGLAAQASLDRSSAAEVVGRLGVSALGDLLLPLLTDDDPDVVRVAAMALGKLGRQDAAPAIGAAMDAAFYVETQRDLALALARLGSPDGIPLLLTGLDHSDDLQRERFFEAFFAATGVHLGYEPYAPRPDRLEAISALQSFWAAEGGADRLVPRDRTQDPVAEAHAWKLVGKLGGSDLLAASPERDQPIEDELIAMGSYAVPALVRGLKYPPGFAAKRVAICRILGRLGDRRAAPALIATLRDPVVSVAAWAAWALEGAGDADCLAALRRWEQRVRTLIATGTMPQEVGPPARILAQAARTRLLLGDDSARPTLVGLLLSDDRYTRVLVFEALQRRYEDDKGYDPDGPAEERHEAAARW